MPNVRKYTNKLISNGVAHIRMNRPNKRHVAPLVYLQKNPRPHKGFTTKEGLDITQRKKFKEVYADCIKENNWKGKKGNEAKNARSKFGQCMKTKLKKETPTKKPTKIPKNQ